MNYFSCFTVALIAVFAFHIPLNDGAIRQDVADEKYQALAQEVQFENVGLILKDGTPNASAVLINASWVLTAGHVVLDLSPEQVSFQIADAIFQISEIIIYPDYQQKKILGHDGDLALLKLEKPISIIEPVTLYTGTSELGMVGTMVGFGRSGSGASIIKDPTPVGTKRAGQNVIDRIGGNIDGREIPDNLLISDFDHPTEPGLNRIGEALPLELEYCPVGGDSGGGLFVFVNDGWYLAGIFTAFTPKINDDLELGIHGSLMYWTRLSLYNNWIKETAK